MNAYIFPQSVASPLPSESPAPIDERGLRLEPEKNAQTQGQAQGVGFMDFLSMILVLSLVIAAIYLVLKALKKARSVELGESASLKVIGSASLSAGRYVHAIKAGTRYFVLASTEASITTVAEIVDKESIDGLELELQAKPAAGKKDFASMLASLLPGSPKEGRKGGADYLRRQRERLKGL
jgi:flagellar biogenesis protein FliO